jgi:hypothetical protein
MLVGVPCATSVAKEGPERNVDQDLAHQHERVVLDAFRGTDERCIRGQVWLYERERVAECMRRNHQQHEVDRTQGRFRIRRGRHPLGQRKAGEELAVLACFQHRPSMFGLPRPEPHMLALFCKEESECRPPCTGSEDGDTFHRQPSVRSEKLSVNLM